MRKSLLLKSLLILTLPAIATLLLIHSPRVVNTVSAQGKGGTIKPLPTPTPAPAAPKKSTPPKRGTPPRNTVHSPSRGGAPKADDAAANERTFWESIRDSNDPEDFRSYLQQYPNGQFSSLARNRLNKLTNAATTSEGGVPASPPPANPSSTSVTALSEATQWLRDNHSRIWWWGADLPANPNERNRFKSLDIKDCKLTLIQDYPEFISESTVSLSQLDPLNIEVGNYNQNRSRWWFVAVWTVEKRDVLKQRFVYKSNQPTEDKLGKRLFLTFDNKETAERGAKETERAIRLCQTK